MPYVIPGCEEGRPTAASLTTGFGFPVPAAFVTLVQAIWDEATARGLDPYDLYHDLLTRPEGSSARHPDLTPWELCPIASTGGDGEHYGYVLHAPELPYDDLPLGAFIPGPGDGVTLIGATTREAVLNLLDYYHPEESPGDAELAVIARLGWTYTWAPNDRSLAFDGKAWRRVRPVVPAGYRYVPTDDGIGVLAPVTVLSEQPALPPRDSPLEVYVAASDQALAAGLVGDALAILRTGYDRWWHQADQSTLDRLHALYDRLGRPVYL